ncbi:hypothetical protein [Rufibacter sp. XAAS-G3-1]|uniref:hypothetical protein n=1 Tax=Rufibacter sp. XAAS-G3-1 TaxID=2729134 RepID=UPI0015E67296|nr:hypothetical protein [Rufibacter sp. XAAS-G3-1]
MLNSFLRIAKHHLKYPLMWVVLLWAVTMPGQEVEVYRFLFFGQMEKNGPETAPGPADGEKPDVGPEEVHVFPDAKASSSPNLELLPALKPALVELPSLYLGNTGPALYGGTAVVSFFIFRLLPSALQPNAP